MAIGADDVSMCTAAEVVAQAGGGLAAAEGETVLGLLPLPIAGLMSDRPIEEVRDGMQALLAVAHGLGATLRDPYIRPVGQVLRPVQQFAPRPRVYLHGAE